MIRVDIFGSSFGSSLWAKELRRNDRRRAGLDHDRSVEQGQCRAQWATEQAWLSDPDAVRKITRTAKDEIALWSRILVLRKSKEKLQVTYRSRKHWPGTFVNKTIKTTFRFLWKLMDVVFTCVPDLRTKTYLLCSSTSVDSLTHTKVTPSQSSVHKSHMQMRPSDVIFQSLEDFLKSEAFRLSPSETWTWLHAINAERS